MSTGIQGRKGKLYPPGAATLGLWRPHGGLWYRHRFLGLSKDGKELPEVPFGTPRIVQERSLNGSGAKLSTSS